MTPAQVAHIMSMVRNHGELSAERAHYLVLRQSMATIEAALRDAPQAEGWVMVPVEPTPAMLVAMWDHREAMRGQSENRIARAGYAAMLAATPSAPTAVEPDERADLKAVVIQLLKHFPTDTDMMEAGWSTADIEAACNAYDLAKTVLARASKGTP